MVQRGGGLRYCFISCIKAGDLRLTGGGDGMGGGAGYRRLKYWYTITNLFSNLIKEGAFQATN